MSLPQTPTPMDRLWKAFQDLFPAALPGLRFFGVYEYKITDVSGGVGGTIDCIPVDPAIKLPGLTQLPMMPSVLGAESEPATGSVCRVIFVNGDPSRPEVTGVEATVKNATVDATGDVEIGPSASAVNLAGGAEALAVGPWADALIVALAAVGTGLTGGGAAPPVTPYELALAAVGTAFTTALGLLPPSSTVKTKAT